MTTEKPDKDRPKILLVEDDIELAKLVVEYLEDNYFTVFHEPRGDQAVKRILDHSYDLIILDIMLPGKDGLAICSEVRPLFNGPIIMLTALGEETDEIVGLQIGADDYLAKPVSPRLLTTRIQSLLRLVKRVDESSVPPPSTVSTEPHIVSVGLLIIDTRNRSATLEGQDLNLTTSEFDLLCYMAERKGEVLDRQHIFRDVLGIEYDGLDRSIDQRVIRLRKKLGDNSRNPHLIKSVRGTGYLLVQDP